MAHMDAPGLVLIVDDDASFVEDLLTLWRPNTEVRRAASSKEALAILRIRVPSLILLDLSLPHELATLDSDEGCRLLAHIRHELDCQAPVVVVTGQTETALHRRALSLGAQAVVTKPVDVDRLVQVILEVGGGPVGG